MAGHSVTSHINTAIRFFQKISVIFGQTNMICSGTGRPVCPIDNQGTAPTTEQDMLVDWLTSLPNRQSRDCTDHDMLRDSSTRLPNLQSGDCTDHQARYARVLVDQFAQSTIWGLYPPPSMICSKTFSFFLTLAPRAYVTYYQAQGLSGHTLPCGEFASFWQTLLYRKVKWAHFTGKEIFFLRAPCILWTTGFFDVDVDQLVFKTGRNIITIFRATFLLVKDAKSCWSKKLQRACCIIIHGARGLAVGV